MNKFSSRNGRRPQTEARRYVYSVAAAMLESEFNDSDGWMFGGITQEPDKRRLTKALRTLIAQMRKKASLT